MINKSPHVLFVTRKFPPAVGGMQRFASDLYAVLNKQDQITLIKWGGRQIWLPFILPYFFVRSIWILLTEDIQIIHMQDGLISPLGAVLKWVFRKPLTVVIHGLDVTYQNGLYQFLIPGALKKADHIFCISNAARLEVINRGIPAAKTSFVPLGVTDDLFMHNKAKARASINRQLKIDPEAKIILCVGRLVERKGVHWFITKVLPELIKTYPDLLFVVSGEGGYRPEIERAIKSQKLSKSVRLLGRTSDSLLKDLYNGADLFVMPNQRVAGDMEGFGRVLLEASLCELPIIATGIEGISDAVIDGKNGYLVAEKDAKAYTGLIKKLFANPESTLAFGRRSRSYTLNHYRWSKIAKSYVTDYQKLIR